MDQIGKLVAGALVEWTGSPQHSDRRLVTKPEIRAPRTADEARALREWAEAQDTRQIPATTPEISKHLGFIAATLPSRNQDEESGKMRVAVYSRLLSEYSNDALAFMARRVCETLDWFPTPRQCLEILAQYRPPISEPETALMLCHRFAQDQFEDFIASFKLGTANDDSVAAVPEQWRRIAMERGYLRLVDGEFVIREQQVRQQAAA